MSEVIEVKQTQKARKVSEIQQELEFFVESTLKEKGIARKDLTKHLDNCPLCHAVIIECPFCHNSIPFSYLCPECKKTLPLETLITKLSETIVEKQRR